MSIGEFRTRWKQNRDQGLALLLQQLRRIHLYSLLLAGLFSGLGDFASGSFLEVDALDDADGYGLPHVTDGEATERREVGEGLDAERLGRDEGDHGSVTRLDKLGVLLGGLAGTAIALLLDLGELAGNVGGVAIQDGGVAVGDLARVVQHDDLSEEVGGTLGRVVLGVTGDVAAAQLLDRDVLHVEADVVT